MSAPPQAEEAIGGRGSVLFFFGMTISRAENICLPRRSTELITLAENTSDGSIWPLYVVVPSVSSRIETKAELDS